MASDCLPGEARSRAPAVHLSDCMGNKCIEGGAHLEVSVNTNGAPKAALTCKCDDQQDGTFLVTWSSEVSHKLHARAQDPQHACAHHDAPPLPHR